MKEKNYMIRYDAKGMVSRVEVYSSAATLPKVADSAKPRSRPPADVSSSPSATSAPRRMPAIRKNSPASKRILSPLRENEAERIDPKGRHTEEKVDAGSEGYEEEMSGEPAGNIPAYIPPRRQQD